MDSQNQEDYRKDSNFSLAKAKFMPSLCKELLYAVTSRGISQKPAGKTGFTKAGVKCVTSTQA